MGSRFLNLSTSAIKSTQGTCHGRFRSSQYAHSVASCACTGCASKPSYPWETFASPILISAVAGSSMAHCAEVDSEFDTAHISCIMTFVLTYILPRYSLQLCGQGSEIARTMLRHERCALNLYTSWNLIPLARSTPWTFWAHSP